MVGLGDEMIREQVDEFGQVWPAYGFFNNDDYIWNFIFHFWN